MGHDIVRTALIYQHSAAETDCNIADAMNTKIEGSPAPADGT
ncbi:hypothetical protein [Nonomuraea sp. NPDC005692]